MRYEPANAKFFETEVRWKSLCSAIKLLGCFDASKSRFESRTNNDCVKRSFDVFEQFFCSLDDEFTASPHQSDTNMAAHNLYQLDEKLTYVCYIMRFLYDTAFDSFDK